MFAQAHGAAGHPEASASARVALQRPVKTHLSAAYRKLGVSNRTELASAVR